MPDGKRRWEPMTAERRADRQMERKDEAILPLIRHETGGHMITRESAGVPYLTFPSLEREDLIFGCSTRLGGVSSGDVGTLNFSVNRGDTEGNVRENYRRMAAALSFSTDRMVLSCQTHTTNVRRVMEEDAGKGFSRERDYEDVDGLMTDVPGLVLVTFYADCVPLFFYDPVRRVIAASHSGWRGTAGRMGRCTVQKLEETYGCRPQDLTACIGPGFFGACYQVGVDVAGVFRAEFPGAFSRGILKPDAEAGKYRLDLAACNRLILLEAGIPDENITVSDVCTCCNRDVLFSHRGNRGKRGTLAAFFGLRS